MKHRKLRIGFLVAYLVVCLPLVVQWVSSYWWRHSLSWRVGYQDIMTFTVNRGQIGVIKLINFESHRERVGDYGWAFSREVAGKPSHFLTVVEKPYKPRYGFEIDYLKHNHCGVYFPYWFFMTLVSMLGAVIWAIIGWINWRFSLRTLLVATAIVAVALAIITARFAS